MLIAKYKFDSSLYDLIPEFNSGYTGYTYTDEVDETNIFDGVWVLGGVNNENGVIYDDNGTDSVRSGYLEIESNTTYKWNYVPIHAAWYDVNKNYISCELYDNQVYQEIHSPNNAKYLVVWRSSVATTDLIIKSCIVTRTIECNTLPTLMRFGSNLDTYVEGSELALLEILDMNTGELTSCHRMFRYCKNLTTIVLPETATNVSSDACVVKNIVRQLDNSIH